MPKKATIRLHANPALQEPAPPEIRPEVLLSGPEPANDASHGQGEGQGEGQGLAISRAELAQAIHHWGQAGQEAEPGMKLTQEASALVEVLAVMDFERQDSVLLPRSSRPGQLVMQAMEAREARETQDGMGGLGIHGQDDPVQRIRHRA